MGRMHNTRVDTGAWMYMCLHTCTHAHIYKCVCVCVYISYVVVDKCVCPHAGTHACCHRSFL